MSELIERMNYMGFYKIDNIIYYVIYNHEKLEDKKFFNEAISCFNKLKDDNTFLIHNNSIEEYIDIVYSKSIVEVDKKEIIKMIEKIIMELDYGEKMKFDEDLFNETIEIYDKNKHHRYWVKGRFEVYKNLIKLFNSTNDMGHHEIVGEINERRDEIEDFFMNVIDKQFKEIEKLKHQCCTNINNITDVDKKVEIYRKALIVSLEELEGR